MEKTKYILIHGVLFRGIPYSILYSILTIFFNPNTVNYNSTQIITRFIAYAILGGLGGIIIGNVKWNIKK